MIRSFHHFALALPILALALFPTWHPPTATAQVPADLPIQLVTFVSGLDAPTAMVETPDGRFFITEQTGRVRVVQDGELLDTPLLDLSGQIAYSTEQGLLSIVLAPDFAGSGVFYVDYTDVDGTSQIVRYEISADDPNLADPESAYSILSLEQPYANHNGGLLLFGPDGNLYIGFGDGGNQGDPLGNGQSLGVWYGKILRIDVSDTDDGVPYTVPDDNPFVNTEGAKPEIFAYGLRNPWRFSFDSETGDLYIADVGGSDYEEVNFLPAGDPGGENFGWHIMEGPECVDGSNDCNADGALTMPVYSYFHESGCTIIGGFVARAESLSSIDGIYLFGDYCSGLIWGMKQADDGSWQVSNGFASDSLISSFAQDNEGNLYLLDLNGSIYQIIDA